MENEESAVSELIELLKKNGYTVINEKNIGYGEPITVKKEFFRFPTIILKDTPVGAFSRREYTIKDGKLLCDNTC